MSTYYNVPSHSFYALIKNDWAHADTNDANQFLVEVTHAASHRCLASTRCSHAITENLMFHTKLAVRNRGGIRHCWKVCIPILMPLGKLKSPECDQPEGDKSKLLFLTVPELLSVNHAMTDCRISTPATCIGYRIKQSFTKTKIEPVQRVVLELH